MSRFLKKEEKKPISFAKIESKRAPRSYKRWVLAAGILSLVLFGLYINQYQKLVNEGSYLADEHCIKINPLIINRKNAYLDQYNLLIASASSELFLESLDKYQIAAKAYSKEEEKWLAKQRKFLDSQSYRLLMPSFTKEAGEYQYQWYEGEYLSSVYLIQGFEESDKARQRELSVKVLEETERAVEGQKKYDDLWDREGGTTDWHYKYFIKVPTPICPKENWDFPVLPDPFEKPLSPNSPLS